MKQDDPQFKLRLKPELKERLEALAKENNRALGAEIVARLEEGLAGTPPLEYVRKMGEVHGRLDASREAFRVVVTEATQQLVLLSKSNEVARSAAADLLETFDAVAAIAQQFFDSEVRDRRAVEVTFAAALADRDQIEERLEDSALEPFPSLGDALRERATEVEAGIPAVAAPAKKVIRSTRKPKP